MKRVLRTLAIGMVAISVTREAADAEDAASPALRRAESVVPRASDRADVDVRNRDLTTLTPIVVQGGSEADQTITRQIREAVLDHDHLSMEAKNVTITTRDAVVTLRGTVWSAEEKATIGDVSTRTSGVMRVDNHLEVAAER